jgi:hypothetical protein
MKSRFFFPPDSGFESPYDEITHVPLNRWDFWHENVAIVVHTRSVDFIQEVKVIARKIALPAQNPRVAQHTVLVMRVDSVHVYAPHSVMFESGCVEKV